MNNLLAFKYEIYRKYVHFISLLIPITYFFISKSLMIYLITFLFLTVLLIDIYRKQDTRLSKYYSKYLTPITRTYESNNYMGATYLCFISFLLILIVPEDIKFIAIFSISYASLSDACAAIYGILYGKTKIINNRTLEGTTLFILFGIFITFLYIFFSSYNFNFHHLIYIFICPFFSSLVEIFSKTEYDNLTVPLFSAVYLYIPYII